MPVSYAPLPDEPSIGLLGHPDDSLDGLWHNIPPHHHGIGHWGAAVHFDGALAKGCDEKGETIWYGNVAYDRESKAIRIEMMRPSLEDDMYRGTGTLTADGLIDFSHVRGGGAWLSRDPGRVGPHECTGDEPPLPLEPVIKYLQGRGTTSAIVVTLPGYPKLAQHGDEWWFGGVLAGDACLYYIPGGARQVLKFDPATQKRTLIGPDLGEHNGGWFGGVLADDGCVYGVPHNANAVLKIDPATQEVTQFGVKPEGRWLGGAVAPNGLIYCSPSSASQVLCIDPVRQTMSLFGEHLAGEPSKWEGAAVAPDGCIYCAPYHAERVLRIDPANGTVSQLGDALGDEDEKYCGAVCGADGNVYCVPTRADHVLKIDIKKQEVSIVGESLGEDDGDQTRGQAKWEFGACGVDGRIYCTPRDARQVLCIDVPAQTAYRVGPIVPHGSFNGGAVAAADQSIYGVHRFNNGGIILRIAPPVVNDRPRVSQLDADPEGFDGWWWGGVAAGDGKIYYIPGEANRVLQYDPFTNTRRLIGPELLDGPCAAWNHKWMFGALGNDGAVYGIPCRGNTVLRIDPITQQVTQFGHDAFNDPEGRVFKYHGGALGSDGGIYCSPWDAAKVLRVDTVTQRVGTIGDELPGGGWIGDVAALDKCVYGIPRRANFVLKIDTQAHTVCHIGAALDDDDNSKYCLGVLGDDGCVYGVPNNADRVLKIDPSTQHVGYVGGSLGKGGDKWEGAARGVDGRLYCSPCFADQVLCIDVAHQTVYRIGKKMSTKTGNMFNGGMVAAADGNLYAYHHPRHKKILRVCPPLFYQEQQEQPPSLGAALFDYKQMTAHIVAHWSALLESAEAEGERTEATTLVCSYMKECSLAVQSEVVLREVLAIVRRNDAHYWPLLRVCCLDSLEPLLRLLLKDAEAGKLEEADLSKYLQLEANCRFRREAQDLALTAEGMRAVSVLLERDEAVRLSSRFRAPPLHSLAVSLLADMLSPAIQEWSQRGRKGSSNRRPEAKRRASRPDGGENFDFVRATIEEAAALPGLLQYLYAPCVFDKQAGQMRCRHSSVCQHAVVHRLSNTESDDWVQACLECAVDTTASKEDREHAVASIEALFGHLSHLLDVKSRVGFPNPLGAPVVNVGRLDARFDGWLPRLVQLSDKQLYRLADMRIVYAVLNHKLTLPPAMLVFLFDIVGIVALLVSFVAVTTQMVREGGKPLTQTDKTLLGVVSACGVYQLIREVQQAVNMNRIGLLRSYITDASNLLQLATSAACLTVVSVALSDDASGRASAGYRELIAFSICLVWLNLISSLRIVHPRLAAFIGALVQTFIDLQFFFVVMLVFFCMFANSYFALLAPLSVDDPTEGDLLSHLSDSSGGVDELHPARMLLGEGSMSGGTGGAAGGRVAHRGRDGVGRDGDPMYSGSLSSTSVVANFFTLWRLMLGDFDPQWLESSSGVDDSTYLMYFVYTIVVVIVLLNILIAVVSDSYDHAMLEAQHIFLRNRVEHTAALAASGVATTAGDDYRVESASWRAVAWRAVGAYVLRPLLGSMLIVELAEKTLDDWMGRALEQERRTRAVVVQERQALSTQVQALEQRTSEGVEQASRMVTRHEFGERMGGFEARLELLENTQRKVLTLLNRLDARDESRAYEATAGADGDSSPGSSRLRTRLSLVRRSAALG